MIGSPAPAVGATRLTLEGVDHSFGGVHAVVDVDLELYGGQICALLGENGAGKSTLMKAVSGALRPDRGTIRLDGVPLPAGDPGAIRRRGVSLIYQELSLVGPLGASENIALGSEARLGPFVDRRRARSRAAELLTQLETDLDPEIPVERLSVAEQQLVEIARALSIDTRVLIMDEPTSALSERETRRLFQSVSNLARRGVCVVFITHRMDEVAALADRVVVMRDGAVVADGPRGELDASGLVRAMVGRTLDRQFPERRRSPGTSLVEISSLRLHPRVHDVSFALRSGEILALSGLVGAGRSDVGRALAGIDRVTGGTIRIDGREVRFSHPSQAIAAGIGWVSEDRKAEGLVLGMSVLANVTLPHLDRFGMLGGWLDSSAERAATSRLIERLAIRTRGVEQPCEELSGGNQQKVAFARWMLGDCRVLICDEPTRGVDVGGRFEIYELLEGLARRGVAVLMISSDMQECLGMADRIAVMHAGRIRAILPAVDGSQERLLHLALGQSP